MISCDHIKVNWHPSTTFNTDLSSHAIATRHVAPQCQCLDSQLQQTARVQDAEQIQFHDAKIVELVRQAVESGSAQIHEEHEMEKIQHATETHRFGHDVTVLNGNSLCMWESGVVQWIEWFFCVTNP